MSERQACKLVDLDRSSYQYEPRPDHNADYATNWCNWLGRNRGTATDVCMRC